MLTYSLSNIKLVGDPDSSMRSVSNFLFASSCSFFLCLNTLLLSYSRTCESATRIRSFEPSLGRLPYTHRAYGQPECLGFNTITRYHPSHTVLPREKEDFWSPSLQVTTGRVLGPHVCTVPSQVALEKGQVWHKEEWIRLKLPLTQFASRCRPHEGSVSYCRSYRRSDCALFRVWFRVL